MVVGECQLRAAETCSRGVTRRKDAARSSAAPKISSRCSEQERGLALIVSAYRPRDAAGGLGNVGVAYGKFAGMPIRITAKAQAPMGTLRNDFSKWSSHSNRSYLLEEEDPPPAGVSFDGTPHDWADHRCQRHAGK